MEEEQEIKLNTIVVTDDKGVVTVYETDLSEDELRKQLGLNPTPEAK